MIRIASANKGFKSKNLKITLKYPLDTVRRQNNRKIIYAEREQFLKFR